MSATTSSRSVGWHSSDHDLFVTYDSLTSKLELCKYSFGKVNSIFIKDLIAGQGQLTCLEWNPTVSYFEKSSANNAKTYDYFNNKSDILAYGTTTGAVNVINFKNIIHSYDNSLDEVKSIIDEELSICNPIKFGKRNCNAVSWNKINTYQVAAGFENTKSDYCALVWDVEKHARLNSQDDHTGAAMNSFTDSLLCRLSQGESCSSLCWLQENPYLLAVGTSMGWLRIYDIRTNTAATSNQCVFSIMAHPAARPRKVKGIRADPFNQSVVATFSDVAGDVVKLWDLRKIVGGTGSALTPPSSTSAAATPPPVINHQIFTIIPRVTTSPVGTTDTSAQQITQPGVTDISWCPYRPGIVAVAISGQKSINIYTVNKSSSMGSSFLSNESLSSLNTTNATNVINANASTVSPLLTINTPETIKSLSWQGIQIRHHLTSRDSSKDSEESFKEIITSLIKTLKKMNISDPNSVANSLINCPFNKLLISFSTYSPVGLNETMRGYNIYKVRERVPLSFSSSSAIVMIVPDKVISSSLVNNNKSKLLQNDVIGLAIGADGIFNEFSNKNKTVFSVSDLNNKSMIMKSRSKSGYSIDANENIEVLACELDVIFSCIHEENKDDSISNQYALLEEYAAGVLIVYRVWLWIDRFETNINENNLSLLNCGILDIMNTMSSKNESIKTNADSFQITIIHPLLGTNIYVSKSRNLCKKLCGWISITTSPITEDSKPVTVLDIDNDLLEVIVEECENLDTFERAAAIALWHGNIELSVKVIRSAITKFGSTLDPLANNIKDSEIESVKSENRYNNEKVEWDEIISEDYIQLVSLVGMCFAGYHSTATTSDSITLKGQNQKIKTNSMWASMCKHLIIKLSDSKRKASSYLQACCVFLLININEYYDGIDNDKNAYNGYTAIINNENIILEDRIAFASTYVANTSFIEWLNKVQEKCKGTGQLDGIIITGLSKDGLDIIQNFIDQYDDIQTSALLVSRIIDHNNSFIDNSSNPIGSSKSPSKFWIWLYEYRNLLNKWEQFIERAYLDVELGKRYRKKSSVPTVNSSSSLKSSATNNIIAPPKANKQSTHPPPFYKSSSSVTSSHSSQQNPQQVQERMKRVMYTIPPHSDVPHIFLRCSYCGATLPVDGMVTNKAETLRSQKNVLNCCANCNKQLPRCYVCQLYMGMINPYLELTRTMNQKRMIADNLISSNTNDNNNNNNNNMAHLQKENNLFCSSSSVLSQPFKSDHNVIDFGKWFFFCQHCRHGGHANCIDEWFGDDDIIISDKNNKDNLDNNSYFFKSKKRIVCGVNGCMCQCKLKL